jgi:hypothetical protein
VRIRGQKRLNNNIEATLQPRLGNNSSISFVGLPGARTLVPKPDCSEHEVQRSKAKSRTEGLQEPQTAHFLIR